ncbi:MAG: hypothetical protein Q4E75_01670 [bacterium]|nr:hypothetical protein [bacterium]
MRRIIYCSIIAVILIAGVIVLNYKLMFNQKINTSVNNLTEKNEDIILEDNNSLLEDEEKSSEVNSHIENNKKSSETNSHKEENTSNNENLTNRESNSQKRESTPQIVESNSTNERIEKNTDKTDKKEEQIISSNSDVSSNNEEQKKEENNIVNESPEDLKKKFIFSTYEECMEVGFEKHIEDTVNILGFSCPYISYNGQLMYKLKIDYSNPLEN